jgi:hypothetical protein
MTLDIAIHDIINDPDGITFVERDGVKWKVLLNEQERELLKERLQEKI